MTQTVRNAALMMDAIVGPNACDIGSLPADSDDNVAAFEQDMPALWLAGTLDWEYATVDRQVRRVCGAAA
jgi:Asp-tRNA(Asn)/Glu-tRNA(Gln) amidotransferase A subunit family amidase